MEYMESKMNDAIEHGMTEYERMCDEIMELKIALRVATIIIEDSVPIPKDAPFMEKARQLVGYKECEQMTFDEAMNSLFDV